MKKLLIVAIAAFAVYSCSDTKKQEKDLLDQLLKVHDKVMVNDELLMQNKMKLDTLLKIKKSDSADIKATSLKLSVAENAMDNWMHKFQPDVTGKSHDQIMNYYSDQKKQIIAVDSQLNIAVAESNSYIKKIKGK